MTEAPDHYRPAIDALQPVAVDLLARYGNDWPAVGTLWLAWHEVMRRTIAASGLAPYHLIEGVDDGRSIASRS